MTGPPLQRGLSLVAYHEGSQVWVPVTVEVASARADAGKRKVTHWHRGVVQVRWGGVGFLREGSSSSSRSPTLFQRAGGLGRAATWSPPAAAASLPNYRPSPAPAAQAITKQPGGDADLAVRTEGGAALRLPASEACLANERDDTVDDLVRSDFLHEPGCAMVALPRPAPPCPLTSKYWIAHCLGVMGCPAVRMTSKQWTVHCAGVRSTGRRGAGARRRAAEAAPIGC